MPTLPIPEPGPSGELTLVVPSCDAYSDTWPFFFHFLFKYWPEVPTPVYLISNHLRYDDARVRTIKVGVDRQWGDNLRQALPSIPGEVFMLMLDDFFLNQRVDASQVHAAVAHFKELQARYLGMDQFNKRGVPVPGTTWHAILPEPPCVGLNATLWRASHLLQVVSSPGMNIWQAECRLKQLAREDHTGHFYIGPEGSPVVTYQESIKGLFWKPSSLDFLNAEGVPLRSSPRPCPPQGDGCFAKLIRSWQKRRLKKWMCAHAAKAAQLTDGCVPPLS